ncbi:J domain-containing protein [Halorubrum trapanicum]|uniref:J domain-containing protein n=1 Tax=Halorubrum trapanicum TaxID=29284 RepID=UPI000BBA64C5|nr:J domain-containing protein [Halorubrum trapanicum]
MDPDLDADDPYDVLGLSKDATDDEVDQRARSLLGDYSDDHAARTAINEAYEDIQQRPSPLKVGDTTVVPLVVSATPDTISVGEEVTVRVTDHTDEGVPGVILRRAEDGYRMGKTGDDGTETVRFNDRGLFTLVASKIQHPDPDHEYKDGEVEITVRARSASGEDQDADDSHDVESSSEATEDEVRRFVRGLLDEYPDEYAARAAINEAFEEIQKRPSPVEVGDTTVVPLHISVTPDTISVGEEVTVRVTDHAGDGVPGVGLQRSGDRRRVGKTGDDGTDTVRFNEAGTHTILASKTRRSDSDHEYRDDEVKVRVEES